MISAHLRLAGPELQTQPSYVGGRPQLSHILALLSQQLGDGTVAQAKRESWPNLHYQSDPRRLWSFLERIGAVPRPPDR